jgi:hypothetical protein
MADSKTRLMVETKRLYFISLFFLLLPFLALANENDMKRLLPGEEISPGFKAKAEPRLYDASNLHEYMNGEAEMYREYGVNKFLSQVYCKGNEEIKVEIAEMVDSISAFGIFSFYRSPDLKQIEAGDEGVISQNQVCFWQDRYYCRITTFGAEREVVTTATKLAKEISSRISVHAKIPEIIGLLPSKDRIKGSEKIIKGMLALNNQYYLFQDDLFGFKAKAVGAFAEYGKPEKKLRLLIVEYPSAPEALDAFNKVSKEAKKDIHFTEYHDDLKGINFLSSKTTGKSLVLQRKKNLLALVIGTDEASGLTLLYELRW